MGDVAARSRGSRSRRMVAAVAVVVGLLLAGCGAAGTEGRASSPPGREAPTADGDGTGSDSEPQGETAPAGLPEGRDVVVTSITDGDTFRAGEERVRLIGVDTPEVSGGVECYGREATAALERLVPPGSRVRLVADVEDRDRYGRTLAYVHRLSDGVMANLALAREGYALPLTIPPNVAHEDVFARAAAEAREAGRGLWAACEDDLDLPPADGEPGPGDGGPGDGRTSTTAGGPTGAGEGEGAGCHPSYPDVCIPPAPPDLDCGDLPQVDIRVLAPDPHRLDGNGDGVGCEPG